MKNVNNYKREGDSLNQNKLTEKFLCLCKCLHSYYRGMRTKEVLKRFILDTDKRLVYLNNPKVACSSIKKSIFGDHPNIHEFVWQYTIYELTKDVEPYYKFTFVRNPYKRLVSCFEDKCLQHPDDICWNYYWLKGLLRIQNFTQFIVRIYFIPNRWAEPHFAGQYQSIYDKKGECLVDYVGKVEYIKDEYEPIRERFDLLPLSHENRAASLTGKNWMDYYTPFTAWLVYRKYKKDFTTFGYEDEYKKLKVYLRNKKAQQQ